MASEIDCSVFWNFSTALQRHQSLAWHRQTDTVYAVIFEGRKFRGRQVRKDFRGLIFADHQIEYIVLP